MNSESTFEVPVEVPMKFEFYKNSSEKEQKRFREWIYDLLKSEVVDLTFEKKDGTIREMKCTLMESKLPPKEPTNYIPKENINSLPVFDLEKNEWRAFRYDSVQGIKFSINGAV